MAADPPSHDGLTHWTASQQPAAGAWAERRDLAAAMRRLIDHLLAVHPPEGLFAKAARQVNAIADELDANPRHAPFEGYAEVATSGDIHAFFDRSPLVGLANPLAPPVRMWAEGERVHGRVAFGAAYEGPPGHVHGGYIAAAFDEALGFAQALTHHPGMTGTLKVKYLRPTPLHRELQFTAWVDRIDGRKIYAKSTLSAGGETLAEADGIFISIDAAYFQSMLARREGRQEGADA